MLSHQVILCDENTDIFDVQINLWVLCGHFEVQVLSSGPMW